MEYDYSKKHARWVAFTFDSKTKISNVSRTEAWMYDKKYPKNIGLMKKTIKNIVEDIYVHHTIVHTH